MNNFGCKFPEYIGNLSRNLEYLNLDNDHIFGSIPPGIVNLVGLQSLSMQLNQFTGTIPSEIGKLQNLHILNLDNNSLSDLSQNKLSGSLPTEVANLINLCYLDVLYNLLSSEILSTQGRCTSLEMLHLGNNFFNETIPYSLSFLRGLGELGLANNNLSGEIPIFGSVYKGVINERIVTVKVLTACSTIDYQGHDFKALVYEFMVNGSLEEWLHPNCNEDLSNEEFKKLNLLQRLNIIIDVVCALNYLHNQAQSLTVHCNLKPSNILLDKDMTGHVEYGMGCEISAYGDIYSFRILVLEMFTGKRPTNEMFKDGLSLHSFVKEALPYSVSQISDPTLFKIEGEEEEIFIRGEKIVECMSLILEIGFICSSKLPRERMDINDAAAKLHFIKDTLLGSKIH
ncbi:receptor kinase-like protein Xa21 [Camellia sinensis]|uniref:receptor kinase-like protein Xa21 n=1 Tax=Camellia sinensis TaxID=4442 RepID=UPI001036DB98|nr:receptor kinase-like protein Xa21 [Camellia sinensis]